MARTRCCVRRAIAQDGVSITLLDLLSCARREFSCNRRPTTRNLNTSLMPLQVKTCQSIRCQAPHRRCHCNYLLSQSCRRVSL